MNQTTLINGDRVRIKPGRFLPFSLTAEDRTKREGEVSDGSAKLGIYGIKFPSHKDTVDYARSEFTVIKKCVVDAAD